VLIIMQKFRF